MKGHIRKRAKGSWTIVVDVGRDPETGKRQQQWHTIKGTKRDAEKALRELLYSFEKGIYIKPNHITLGEWLFQWLNSYVSMHTTASTQESYQYIISRHLNPALGTIPLTHLRPHHLQSYYASALSNGRLDGKGGLSSRSVLYHHRILSEALTHAVKMEFIARNIAESVDPPRAAHPIMATLAPGEISRFLEATRETPYYVLFSLLLCTGLRSGEALGLRWRNLDDDLSSLSIVETARKLNNGKYVIKEPKTPHSRRMVALPYSLTLLLRHYRVDQELLWIQLGRELTGEGFVFGRPDGSLPGPASITKAFSKAIRNVGLPHIRIHDLRHTHATLLLKAGVHPKVVSERLGHASVAITLDTYSHVLPGLQEAAAESFDKMLETEIPSLGESNVSKMLADRQEGESRPYRSRTCDTLIKSQVDIFTDLDLSLKLESV